MVFIEHGADNSCCLSITSTTSSGPPGMLARLTRQAISSRVRNYATVATNDPSKIRNIALVAHIGIIHFWLFQPLGSDNPCIQIPGRPP